MKIDHPTQTEPLRRLWKSAFADTDDFLDLFFSVAYSPRRCRCITKDGEAAAALYWFDCFCGHQKFAYLYAVATSPRHRRQGLCRALMDDVKQLLGDAGYHGLLLVPENEALAAMYRKMGFTHCTSVSEFRCTAGTPPVELHTVDIPTYAQLRRSLLPSGGTVQEGANLDFLAAQTQLLAGENCLCAVFSEENTLHCCELLGDAAAAPGILRRLGYEAGTFRIPGNEKPFAMGYALKPDCVFPTYFGLPFD